MLPTLLTVPFEASQKLEQRERAHQQIVAAILNSLLYQGYIVQTGVQQWQLASANQGAAGGVGPPGPPGMAGSAWSSGIGTPLPSQGRLSDYYFQTETGQVWQKTSMFFGIPPRWVLIARLPPRGQQGLPGTPGAAGAPGPPGAQGASGAAGGGALSLISTATASNSATLAIGGLTGNSYLLVLDGLMPQTDGQQLLLRVGQGAGPSYQSGASYQTAGNYNRSTSITGDQQINATSISLTIDNVNGGGGTVGVSGNVYCHSFQSSALAKNFDIYTTFYDGTGITRSHNAGYFNGNTTVLTGIQIRFGSGNITSGSMSLYQLSQ